MNKKEDNYTSFEEIYDNESISDTTSEVNSDVSSELDYKVKRGHPFFTKSILNVILTILFVSLSIFGLNSEFYTTSNYKLILKVSVILAMSIISFMFNYFF